MKANINSSLLSKIELKQKEYDIWDIKLKGFILRVIPTGHLVYQWEYTRACSDWN